MLPEPGGIQRVRVSAVFPATSPLQRLHAVAFLQHGSGPDLPAAQHLRVVDQIRVVSGTGRRRDEARAGIHDTSRPVVMGGRVGNLVQSGRFLDRVAEVEIGGQFAFGERGRFHARNRGGDNGLAVGNCRSVYHRNDLHLPGGLALRERHASEPYQQHQYDEEDEQNEDDEGRTETGYLPAPQGHHARRPHRHAQREVGLRIAGPVLRHAVELARIGLLGVRQHEAAALLEMALLVNDDPLVRAEGGVVHQGPPVPVPIYVGRRNRVRPAHNRRVIAGGRFHVSIHR